MGHEKTLWIFPNVLCQIGLGYFFAWVMHHWRPLYQVIALFVILGGYWGWFYMILAANYDYAAVSATQENGEILENLRPGPRTPMRPTSSTVGYCRDFDQQRILFPWPKQKRRMRLP